MLPPNSSVPDEVLHSVVPYLKRISTDDTSRKRDKKPNNI